MVPKTHVSNRPGERVDVKVREVVIVLAEQEALPRLVIGLPVDVYLEAGASQSPATASILREPASQVAEH